MRLRHVATTVAAVSVGLTAAAALRERAERRASVGVLTPGPVPAPIATVAESGSVVLPFVRPAVPAPVADQSTAPSRCGDNGGLTKAGAPCGARATTGGRCHHHRLVA